MNPYILAELRRILHNHGHADWHISCIAPGDGYEGYDIRDANGYLIAYLRQKSGDPQNVHAHLPNITIDGYNIHGANLNDTLITSIESLDDWANP